MIDDTEMIPTPHRTECSHERRFHALEKTVGEHGRRLHEGDIALVKLNLSIEQLTASINRLEQRITAGDAVRDAGNPTLGKVRDAAIAWAVPVIILGVLWVMAKSGVIPGIQGGAP